ncbi:MAG: hypothetical protein PHV28_05650 [Kiritimatiellae bacterium]|nr:hypothetical protein [Kiritimatiellia bacterium]
MKKTILFPLATMLLTAGAADVPFTRTVSHAAKPGARERRLDKTLIFAERQLYGPYQNLLHRYTDRPLFLDVTLRDDPEFGSYAAFFRDIEILRNAGLDGFGSLDYFNVHRTQLRLLEKRPPAPGYSQMIVFPGYWATNRYADVKGMILEAAKSPFTTRLDGKLLMWCYGNGADAHEAWARRLRADKDIPPFLFIGDMPFFDIYTAFGTYEKGKSPQRIPPDILDAFRRKVAKAAEALDGFQLWCTEYYPDHIGEYPRHSLKTRIYRDYLLPIAEEVMGRPENKGKFFGTYLRNGYVNPFAGTTDGEYGTETLRSYLDEILLVNPDVLMLFEWNEANENTHFQPTVAHGRTWERILAYYRSVLDRTPPAPRPGDDTTVPNLVLSVRQALKLGEPYHLELLYLPDGTVQKEVTARVTLKDGTGCTLVTFPSETIPTGGLLAIDYRVPSEYLALADSVTAELETEYAGRKKTWRGFDSTRLSATTCRDYLYSHHPLRELIEPETYGIGVLPAAGKGTYAISASFACGEKLAALELLDGLEEVAAADRENIFDRSNYAILRGRFTSLIPSRFGAGVAAVLKGTARTPGAPNAILKSGHYAWESFGVRGKTGDVWNVTCHFGGGAGTFFALVPKGELAGAKIVFDFEKLGSVECALDDAHRLGKKGLELKDTARLDVERLDDLADYPKPVDAPRAEIRVTLPSANRFPAYQLRAVTASGKVWRSALVHPETHAPETATLQIFSDTAKQPVNVCVAKDRIPDLVYSFDPKYGAWLPCSWERRFDAQLGGSGRYAEPMDGAAEKRRLPPDFVRPDPEWAEEGGRPVLKFSKGCYLTLPQEAIPRGAVYTLSFEVKPETAGNQVLLRSRGTDDHDCGLQLVLENGTLRVSHFGILLVPRHFDTGLPLKPGEWNTVTVQKDFETIRCTVNGTTKKFGYDRRARRFQACVFGGNVAPGPGIPEKAAPFTGLLRALRVRHDCPAGQE